jgi:O-antigen/teichoic acid export membrane protein
MGINAGIFRSYYEVSDSQKKVLLFSGISSSTILLSLLVGIGVVFAESFSEVLFSSSQYANIIRIALLQIPIVQLFDHYCTLLRYQKKVKQFVAISGLQVALSLIFLLFYVVFLKLGILGVYLNIITSNLIPLLIIMIILRKYYVMEFNIGYVKDSLSFSIPLMPGWFIIMYLMQANRFFLQAYHSPTEVGIYSIAARIAGICGMIMSMFMLAWDPLSYKLIPQKAKYYLYDSVARIFLFSASIIILGVTYFAKEILIILTTAKYYPAYKIVGIISMGILVMYFNSFIGMGIIISKRTIYKSVAMLIGALISTLSYVFFIPVYGIQAAASGLLIGYIISAIPLYYYGNKYCLIPFNIKRIGGTLALLIISVYTYYYFSGNTYTISLSWISIKILIILTLSYALMRIAFTPKEVRDLLTQLSK